MKKNVKQILIAMLAIAFAISACKKEDEGTPPELPPVDASFKIVTDDFKNSEQKTIENWFQAAIHVGVWQTAINVTMAVPVAAFTEAVKNHEPVYVGEKTWEWAYSFQFGVNQHSAKLKGTIRGDSVDWKMYISKSGAYENFLWYTGTNDIAGTGGYWNLVKSPTETGSWIHIDWKRNGDGTGFINYSGVNPTTDIYGDYIHAQITDDEYDANYDIRDASDGKELFIEWSREFKNGRLKYAKYYGDDNWHCWDVSLQDIDCP